LLACGILSSLVYVIANVVGAMRWEGYSSISQTVSELSAIGAPSRPTMIPLFLAYSVLLMAFGVGIWESAGRKRALRVVAVLVIAFGALCVTGPFTPMHRREVLAAGGATLTDTLHIALTMVDGVFLVSITAIAATLFGKPFRLYSIATIVTLLAFGALAGLDGPRVSANLPTPWVGLVERVCIGSSLLWFAVFAVRLLRDSGARGG
jgi:hypothetical protein